MVKNPKALLDGSSMVYEVAKMVKQAFNKRKNCDHHANWKTEGSISSRPSVHSMFFIHVLMHWKSRSIGRRIHVIHNMGVSVNGGTPKWMVYNGKPYWNGWFGGTTILGFHHIAPHSVLRVPVVIIIAPSFLGNCLVSFVMLLCWRHKQINNLDLPNRANGYLRV